MQERKILSIDIRKQQLVIICIIIGTLFVFITKLLHHKENNDRNSSVTGITYPIAEIQNSQSSCARKPTGDPKFVGSSGDLWTAAPGNGWCEYKKGNLRRSWASMVKSKPTHVLQFQNEKVYLGHVFPEIRNIKIFNQDSCKTPPEYVIKDVLPSFGHLQICHQAETLNHHIVFSLNKTPFGYLPQIVITPKNKYNYSIIYLNGGPYVQLFSNMNKVNVISKIIRAQNVRLIVPLYLGTYDVSVSEVINYRIAKNQIEYLINDTRNHGQLSCAIGSSLGAVVLASVSKPRVARLLISPLIDSPNSAIIRNIRSKYRNPTISIPVVAYSQWKSGSWGPYLSRKEIRRSDAFLRYFGTDASLDLRERLRGHSADVVILYGNRDQSIGLESLPDLAAEIGRSKVRDVGSVDHYVDEPANFWAFESEIDKFFSKCVARDEPRDRENA